MSLSILHKILHLLSVSVGYFISILSVDMKNSVIWWCYLFHIVVSCFDIKVANNVANCSTNIIAGTNYSGKNICQISMDIYGQNFL